MAGARVLELGYEDIRGYAGVRGCSVFWGSVPGLDIKLDLVIRNIINYAVRTLAVRMF